MNAERLARLLPEVFQRSLEPGSPLVALLGAMEALHEPSLRVLADLGSFFDPRRTPSRFVPYLARWVDLDLPVTTGEGRMRELIALAVELSRLRGTRKALNRFLTVATGIGGFEIDDDPRDAGGRPRPFHIVIGVPPESLVHELMIRAIVELEKPAYVTYELVPRAGNIPPKERLIDGGTGKKEGS